jgi:hypothetical protein
LERELAPFVEQARAKAKAILAARVAARVAAEDELSNSDNKVRARPPLVQGPALASPVRGSLALASPTLEPRPKRAQKLPKRYC